MAVYVKIHCGNCKQDFERYHKDFALHDDIVRCPFCNMKMTETQRERIKDIFLSIEDVNYQSKRAHEVSADKPLFTICVPEKVIDEQIEIKE